MISLIIFIVFVISFSSFVPSLTVLSIISVTVVNFRVSMKMSKIMVRVMANSIMNPMNFGSLVFMGSLIIKR